MEYGQPHARVDNNPMFKTGFSPHKPTKNLASGDKWGGGGGVISSRPPLPFVELMLKSQAFFSRVNWVPPPSPARECCSSPIEAQGGRHTPLRGRGWGIPIPTKGRSLWYSVYTTQYSIPQRLKFIIYSSRILCLSFCRPVIFLSLVGFGRACAPVRCAHPSFWALPSQTERCAPPPTHRSFAASYLTPKINKNY
jgi:hypothetical protein